MNLGDDTIFQIIYRVEKTHTEVRTGSMEARGDGRAWTNYSGDRII